MRADPSEFTVLRTTACRANVELARRGLARFTFGNASAIDRELGVVAIKPSGVPYDDLTPESMVVVELGGGKIADGGFAPVVRSRDAPRAVSRFRRDRRRRAHALALRDGVGTGAARDSVLRHDARGLFSRSGAGHGAPRESRDHAGLRGEHRTRDRAPVRAFGAGSAAHAGMSRRGARELLLGSVGGDERWRSRICSRMSRGWRTTPSTLNAAADPIPSPLLDKHFLRKHGPDAYYGQEDAAPTTKRGDRSRESSDRRSESHVEGAAVEFDGLYGR